MLNKDDIKAYRNISAPQSLYEKVMAAPPQTLQKTKVFPVKKLLAAAACIAVIIAAVPAYLYSVDVSASFYGTEITAEGVEMPLQTAKYTVSPGVPIDFKAYCKTEISVSSGTLEVYDVKTAEPIFTGSDGCFSGEVSVLWITDFVDYQRPLYMTVSNFATEYVLELEADENGLPRITKTENTKGENKQ